MSDLLGLLSPLRHFYDFLNEGIIVVDSGNNLLYSNPSAEHYIGGANGFTKRFKTKPALDSDELKTLLQGNKMFNGHATLTDGNNNHHKTPFFCYSINDDVTGEHLGKLIFFQDPLTNSEDGERFKGKAELLTALNGCTSEIVFILDTVAQRVVFVNDVVNEFLGWHPEDFLNGGWPFSLSLLHPVDLEMMRKIHREHVVDLSEKSSFINAYRYDARMKASDGMFVKFHFTGNILEADQDGNPTSLLFFGKPQPDGAIHLTPREIEIARLLVQGHSSKMIAATFNLSVHTVNDHRTQLMKKAGTTNTAALVNYLIENKLV